MIHEIQCPYIKDLTGLDVCVRHLLSRSDVSLPLTGIAALDQVVSIYEYGWPVKTRFLDYYVVRLAHGVT